MTHLQFRSVRPTRRQLAMFVAGSVAALGLVVVSSPGAVAVTLNDCQDRDNGDPRLLGFEATAKVDVRHTHQLVSFRVQAMDTGGPGRASGLTDGDAPGSAVSVYLTPPNGRGELYADLSKHHHVFSGGLTIPRGSPRGKWTIELVLADAAGNTIALDSAALDGLDLPDSIRVISTRHPIPAPVLKAFSFSPGRVDTRDDPKTITFTARVRSPLRTQVYVGADGPGHESTTPPASALLERVRGKPNTYRGAMHIRRWRGAGTVRWRVLDVWLSDAAGNRTLLGYRDLGAAGFPRSFRVTSRTDLSAARLRTFSRTPPRIDVRTEDGKIHVTVEATDRGSGVSSVRARFADPQEYGTFSAGAELHRVSGSSRQGTWKAIITVPHCAADAHGLFPGDVFLRDYAGNYGSAEFLSSVSIVSADLTFPSVNPDADVPVGVTFDDFVNGITPRSAPVRRGSLSDDIADPVVPGSWSCSSASSGQPTDCVDGRVYGAEFTPSEAFEPGAYYLTLNPEHSLGVRDAAGNAPRRQVVTFEVP